MKMNFIAILVAALVPMIMGFIWYNPKVMGKAWMRETGLTEEKMKGANMALLFGLAFLFSFLLAFSMQLLVIHQVHFAAMLMHHQQELNDTSTELGAIFQRIMSQYGNEFRTFKHGAFHGFTSSVLILLPVLATGAMFERKSWKYIWINWGYWCICFIIMGGIVCGWQ